MADGEDLTAEQTEKLVQFQDLERLVRSYRHEDSLIYIKKPFMKIYNVQDSDLTSMDMDRCRAILERHNWDIEVAVQDRFNEEEGRSGLFTEQRQEPRPPVVHTGLASQRTYTVARPRPHGFLGWGYFIILFPFRFVYTTVLDLLRFAYRLLRPDPRRYVTDPLGDVMSFIRQYEEKYGAQHPTFYQGTYSQALTDAKRELRFLLVYLHGEDHQDTPGFCRSTLSSMEVAEFINTNMLFWACSTNSPEGYRVSQALRENTYPFLAVIVLRENRMTVVARMEGPIGGEDLVRRLGRAMADNETSLIAARAEREERNFNQTLREQQDLAYQESLRADQEKEKKKREERERQEREKQEAIERQQEEERKLEELALRKEELRKTIPDEPAADDPDAIRVSLKLPNGSRLQRTFRRSESLKHLQNFVFCHNEAPDDFQIITNFPRRTLPCQNTADNSDPPTFADVGLGKSESLFVHDNEA